MKLDQLIEELNKIEFPEKIILGPHATIVNVPLFISSNINFLKGNPANKTFSPYYDQLLCIYKMYRK